MRFRMAVEDLQGVVTSLDDVLEQLSWPGAWAFQAHGDVLREVRDAVAAAAGVEEREDHPSALGHRVSVDGVVIVSSDAAVAEVVLLDEDGSVIAAASGSSKRHPEDPPSYDVGLRLAIGRAFAQLGLGLVDGAGKILRGDERA